MNEGHRSALLRVKRLVAAARRLADPHDELGIAARRELPIATGLSPEGVEHALTRSLETDPSEDDLDSLVRSVPAAPRALVLLSANVFVAAHRALALALAASEDVVVRPSRREPKMVELLARATPDSFRIVSRLEPRAGDHLWAYGSESTLEAVQSSLPPDVTLHAHGPGMGVVFIEPREGADFEELAVVARAVADDVIAFDQRGCLSPRVVFVSAEAPVVRAFASALAQALAFAERRVPPGRLDPREIGDRTRYRDAMLVAGAVLAAGAGCVGLDMVGDAVAVPPAGRNVHVVRCTDVTRARTALAKSVVAVGVSGSDAFVARIATLFPDARMSHPGAMQRPPLDGPADTRHRPR